MKGFVIHRIISNLGEKEFDDFLLWGSMVSKKNRFTRFCKFLRKFEYSEDDAMRILGVSKTRKNELLGDLGGIISAFIGERSKLFHFENLLEVSKRLALAMETEASLAVLKPIGLAVSSVERYDLILRVWDILRILGIEPEFELISIIEAQNQIETNSRLGRYLQQAIEAKNIQLPSKRIEILKEIREAALNEFRKGEIGQRGQYIFLKIHARIDSFLRDSKDWPLSQEAVIAQIRSNPWLCEDYQFDLARAERTLLQYFWQANYIESYETGSKRFIESEFSSRRANFEKYYFQFPFLFAVAIDTGDQKLGQQSALRFEEMMNREGDLLPRQFQTLNLYWCTAFHISNQNIREASRCLIRLSKYSRTDIAKHLLPLVSILEIVVAIESCEFEDANRLVKNLTNSTKIGLLPGTEHAITLLRTRIRLEFEVLSEKERHDLSREIEKIVALLEGQTFLKYFNIKIWNDSRINNRPMLEISSIERID